MTDIVTPRVVPDMPPAPLPTDPPQIFDDKCVALASGYAPFVAGANNSAADTNQNATAAHERAALAQGAWASVAQGVADVQAALAAIQAGPVASVMGRTGVVKGLVEQSNAAIPTGTSLDTLLTTGFYQLGTHSIGGVSLAAGQLMVSHSVDSVMQLGIDWTGTNVAIRSRGAAANQWSPGQRLIGDRSEMSRTKFVTSPGGSYRADPAEGAIHVVDVRTNMTITIPAPRQAGDQLVLRMLMYTSSSLSFTSEAAVSTVKAPVGGLPSNLQINTVATFVLLARDANLWEITYTTSHPF